MHPTDDQRAQHHISDVRLPSHTREPAMRPVIPSSLQVIDDHGDKGNGKGKPNLDPLTTAPRWALCPLNWQAHAIDPYADHPLGLWIARCGHRLSGGTPLYDLPQGHQCPSCAKWSQTSEPKTRAGQ